MSARHSREQPPTVVESASPSATLSDVGQRLRDAVTAAQQAAIDEAVVEAVAASDRRGRRTYWLSVLGAFLLALAVSLPLAVLGYVNAERASSQTAELTAGNSFDSNIDSTRQSNLLTARRHLTEVNDARRAAGLVAVPDPGLNASSGEVDAAWTLGLSDLLTIGTLQERGVQVPGVTAPRPNSGSFPFPRASG